jgi:glycine cleavage system aminomethyltransferase T
MPAGAMKMARLSTTARSRVSKKTNIAGRPPIRACAGFGRTALNMDVQIEDISEQTAALALQGPASAKLLKTVAEADIANLKYFRKTSGKIAGVAVDISRTGYTGDLGYEIWMPWDEAVKVWDALMDKGKQFDIHAAGMLALGRFARGGGTAADRGRLHQFEEGADSLAEVFAV